MSTDVLIVGAGPTGLSLACQFIRHGVEFVVVEKNACVTPYSKAIGVHARTLEIYEQLGLAREALEQGTIAGKVRLLAGGERHGSLSRHDGDEEFKVKAGDRMPYFTVGGESVYDRLRGPKFHLLVFTGEPDSTQVSETSQVGPDPCPNRDLFDLHTISLGKHVAEVFGAERPFSVLLRPDNYIGYISPETSPGGLKAYLRDFVGHTCD